MVWIVVGVVIWVVLMAILILLPMSVGSVVLIALLGNIPSGVILYFLASLKVTEGRLAVIYEFLGSSPDSDNYGQGMGRNDFTQVDGFFQRIFDGRVVKSFHLAFAFLHQEVSKVDISRQRLVFTQEPDRLIDVTGGQVAALVEVRFQVMNPVCVVYSTSSTEEIVDRESNEFLTYYTEVQTVIDIATRYALQDLGLTVEELRKAKFKDLSQSIAYEVQTNTDFDLVQLGIRIDSVLLVDIKPSSEAIAQAEAVNRAEQDRLIQAIRQRGFADAVDALVSEGVMNRDEATDYIRQTELIGKLQGLNLQMNTFGSDLVGSVLQTLSRR